MCPEFSYAKGRILPSVIKDFLKRVVKREKKKLAKDNN